MVKHSVAAAVATFVSGALLAGSPWTTGGRAYAQSPDCAPEPMRLEWTSGGAHVSGFVGTSKAALPGVAVSRWSAGADMGRVKQCGGIFSYVRLSAGSSMEGELSYVSSWLRARAAGLEVGGYHSLSFAIGTTTESMDVERARQEGRKQAAIFVDRLAEVRRAEMIEGVNTDSRGVLPPMLSLSNVKVPGGNEVKQSEPVRAAVRAAVCSWVEQVRTLAGNANLRFAIYGSLNQFINLDVQPCDGRANIAWIAFFTKDAEFPTDNPKVQAVCGNKKFECLFHHYTSSSFLWSKSSGSPDVSRFFGSPSSLVELRQSLEPLYQRKRSPQER